MAFFYDVVMLDSRLPPEEVERRLQLIVRKPRTFAEVLRRTPPHPPEWPEFVGSIADGRFTLTPLVLAPDDIGHSTIRRPPVRGWITPAEKGSQIRLLFCDPALSAMAIGMMAAASFIVLATTRGWPLWRMEHGLLVIVIGAVLWFCRQSLTTDVARATELIRRCVK